MVFSVKDVLTAFPKYWCEFSYLNFLSGCEASMTSLLVYIFIYLFNIILFIRCNFIILYGVVDVNCLI